VYKRKQNKIVLVLYASFTITSSTHNQKYYVVSIRRQESYTQQFGLVSFFVSNECVVVLQF